MSAASPGSAAGDRPLSVAVNLLWLVPGVVGGSETYAVGVLRAWAADPPPGVALTLFVNGRFAAAHPAVVAAFPTVAAPVSGTSRLARVATETTWLGRRIRDRFDVVHHVGGTVPRWCPAPAVVTVHDLQPLVLPQHFHPVKRRYLAASLPRSVHAARRVVTLSDHVRRDVHQRLGVPLDRIDLVPPGLDHDLVRRGADQPVDALRTRYDLGERPYFLYPAITYPHKNHAVLVEAFAQLRRHRDGPDAPLLVLTGGPGPAEDDLRSLIARLGVGRHVRRTGRIPYGDVGALMTQAAALVFPSRFEGFGLPTLEAMARGCPVLAADATSLPDVVGGAGWLIDPASPARWCEAMARILDEPDARARLIDAGRRRAGEFGWGRSIASLAEVYRRAATP